MIGLASAGCSRAVRRRPNAALVAESKTSGSSSSGGAVASGMSSAAGAGVEVFLGCRRSCNRTSALVFIEASVEGLVGTGAGAPIGRPRGRGSAAVGSQWSLSLSNERAQWKWADSSGIVGVPTMLFAMSTQNHCDPERAVEGMATKIATENRR